MQLFPLEFFWVLVMAAGLYGTLQVQKRLRVLIDADPSLAPGAKVLVRTMVVLVTVVPIMNGALMHFGGFSRNPAWWASSDLSNPYVLTHFLFLWVFAGVALWWVWAADGPRRLLKYRDAFPTGANNPFALGPDGMKWFVTLVTVGFLTLRVGLLFAVNAQ